MAFTIVLGLAVLSAANYGNAFEFSGLDPSAQSKTQLTPTIKPANQPQDQIKPAFGLKNASPKPFGVPSFDSLKPSYQPYQPPGPFRTNYQPFGPYPGYPGPVVYPGHGGHHGRDGCYHGHGGHHGGDGGYPGPGAFPHPPAYRFDGADHKPFGFRPPYYPEQPIQQTYPTNNSPFKFGPSKKFNKYFPAPAEFNQPGKYYQEHQFGAYHGPEFSSAIVPAEHNVKSSKPKDTLLGKPAVPNLSEFGLSKQAVYGFAAPQSFQSFAGHPVPNFPPIPAFFGAVQPSVKTVSSTAAAEQKAVDETAAAVTTAAVPSPSQDGSPATPQQVPVAKAEQEEVTGGEPSAAAEAQPAQEEVADAEVATNNEVPAAADDATAAQQQQSSEPTEIGEPGAADGETPVGATKEPVVVAADPSVQGSSDQSVQGSSDPSVQGSSDQSVQGSSDPSVQGSSDQSVQGSSDPSVQGSSDPSVQGSSDPSVQGSSDGPSAQEVSANSDGPAVNGGGSDAAQAADEKAVQQNAVTAANVAPGVPNELVVPGAVNEAALALSDPSSVGLFSGIPYFGQPTDFQQGPPSYASYYNNEPKFTEEELRAALAGSGFSTGFLQSPEYLGGGGATTSVSEGVNGAGVIVSKSTVPVAVAPSAKGVGKADGSERKETVGTAAQSNVAAATTPKKGSNTVQILSEDQFNGQLPLLYDPSNAGSPLDAYRFYSNPPVSALSGQASLASYSPEDAFSSFGSQFRQGYLVAGSPSPVPVTRTVVQTVGQTPVSIASKDHPLHSEIFRYPQSFVPYPQVVSSAGSSRSLEAPSPSSAATSVAPSPAAAAAVVPSTAPAEAAVQSTSGAKTVV